MVCVVGAWLQVRHRQVSQQQLRCLPSTPAFSFRYNYISSALIISSFPKLLFILMIIWDYDELEFSWLVNLLVLTSNAEALSGL